MLVQQRLNGIVSYLLKRCRSYFWVNMSSKVCFVQFVKISVSLGMCMNEIVFIFFCSYI